MKKEHKLKDLIIFAIFSSLLLLIIFLISFFCGGTLMLLFGLKYSSIKVLIKFFIIYFVVDLIIDNILEPLATAIKEVKNLSDIQYNILYFFMDVPIQILILGLISSSISGIHMPVLTIILFSIAYYFIGYFLNKKLEE
ncbi:YrvL family regulatory protein [Clostridium septicum]|uniref:YrvL family regulatory protein n=1 Tax=Clostridium septicum TaxID=1504 RepID=UPI00272DCC41|nr:YrvL family regulatory protein [Clostridium septicum]WLF69041.1 YrvL family regulatory protein [Clostridium septicum]